MTQRALESYVDSRGRMPSADVAVKIAQALGVTVEYLVTGKESNISDFEKYKSFQTVLDELLILPEEILQPILAMIHTAAQAELEKKKDKVLHS